MRSFGNVIWMLLFGWWSAALWFVLGILWCVTIIGMPFGKQCFKFAELVFMPFRKDVVANFAKHPIANIIWIIFGGLELAIAYVIGGVICCITVVGIPFGKQCFKLAALSLAPFGAKVK